MESTQWRNLLTEQKMIKEFNNFNRWELKMVWTILIFLFSNLDYENTNRDRSKTPESVKIDLSKKEKNQTDAR
jgi:hypothetical protein